MASLLQTLAWILYLSCVYPLARAWRANHTISLRDSVAWACVAWLSWLAALAGGQSSAWHYMALCLTGCTGVAVLGARRPGVTAWNFVVLALLAVQSMPLAESLLRGGRLELDGLRIACLAGTLAVGVLNYLPTVFAPAALLLLAACGLHFAVLINPELPERDRLALLAYLSLGCVPWLALGCIRPKKRLTELDRRWLWFRNRYGMVWGQRLREQFNRSAVHAGLPVVLHWVGFRVTGDLKQEQMDKARETLIALMKRFGETTV